MLASTHLLLCTLKTGHGHVIRRNSPFDEFEKVVNEPNFTNVLEAASRDPTGPEAKVVQQRVLPLLTLSGKRVPWGRLERASLVGQLLLTNEQEKREENGTEREEQ